MTHSTNPTQKYTRSELVSRLVRAGELQVSGEDQAELDSDFDRETFRFHGPDGFEADSAKLSAYFASVRAAFDDTKITRGIVVADPTTQRARLSYRRAATLFEEHTTSMKRGRFHAASTEAQQTHARRRGQRVHADADGVVLVG
jgi:hypothetical protein